MIPLGSTELLGTGKQSLAQLSMLLLIVPGCNSLGINRAAGYREAELGTVAIVVVARVVCCYLLVFFGEYLDTCWDKNGKSVSGCF